MLKCKKCGKENAPNNKFCDGCGGELESFVGTEKKKKGIIRYIIGILVILGGISACYNSNFISGITLILTGASLLPVIYDTLFSSLLSKNNFFKNLHIILPLIFFLSFVVLNPIDDKIRDNKEAKEKAAEYKEFSWPNSDIAKLIPEPKSKKGKINWEKSDGFYIEVSETSFKDYNNYVDSCQEKGFTIDYSKGDDYYRATNENGFKLSLSYDEDDKVMDINISKPSEEKPSEPNNPIVPSNPTEPETPTTPEKPSTTGIRPEVKEFLDSYESVMNEYIDFMNKYKASNYSASMLSDYLKILEKYNDFIDKIDKVDESSYNDEEMKYYLEVTNRVTQKLAGI